MGHHFLTWNLWNGSTCQVPLMNYIHTWNCLNRLRERKKKKPSQRKVLFANQNSHTRVLSKNLGNKTHTLISRILFKTTFPKLQRKSLSSLHLPGFHYISTFSTFLPDSQVFDPVAVTLHSGLEVGTEASRKACFPSSSGEAPLTVHFDGPMQGSLKLFRLLTMNIDRIVKQNVHLLEQLKLPPYLCGRRCNKKKTLWRGKVPVLRNNSELCKKLCSFTVDFCCNKRLSVVLSAKHLCI